MLLVQSDKLIRIPFRAGEPINNDQGKLCSINTINLIFAFANLPQYLCTATEKGTTFAVSYVLVNPETSASCSFAGWQVILIIYGKVLWPEVDPKCGTDSCKACSAIHY